MGRFPKLSILILLFAALPVRGLAASAVGISGPPGLQFLIQEAWRANKGLVALSQRIEAVREEALAAGSLDDPRIGLTLLNVPTDTFDFDQEAMTQKQITLSQRLPWFGRLDLKTRVLVLESSRLEAELQARKLALARQVADAYWQLALRGRSLEINQRLKEMVSQLLRVSETRYATGKGLQQDVLQGQVELSKLIDERLILEKQKQVAESRINELLNRPGYLPVRPETEVELPGVGEFDQISVRRKIIENNPYIRGKLLAVQKARAQMELVDKDYYPNFDVRLAYGQRDDEPGGRDRSDFMSVGVVFNIPLWQKNKQDRRLEAARLALDAARNDFGNLADGLPHRAMAVAQEISSLHENIRLYHRALIFQARQWAKSAMAAYEVGKIEFRTLLAAHIRVLRLELQADAYKYTLLRKHAELEEIIGGRLEPGQPHNTAKGALGDKKAVYALGEGK